MRTTTHVPRICVLLGCGIASSAQIGKAIIALPLIQQQMMLGLESASLLIAVFATLGAFLAMGAGIIGRKLGPRRTLLLGMSVMAVASGVGGFMSDFHALLLTRIIEGVGFLGAVVVVPDLMRKNVSLKNRDLILGLWGTYMPIGSGGVLFLGPLLQSYGWQNMWFALTGFVVVMALLAYVVLPSDDMTEEGVEPEPDIRFSWADIKTVLMSRPCQILAAMFGLYTFQYFILAGFMPLLFVEQLGLTLSSASLLTAIAIYTNALGNISASFLLRAGMPIWLNMTLTFLTFGATSLLIYTHFFSPFFIALAAALTLGMAGLTPASTFAALPRLVARRDLVTPTVGMIQQASNIGQFIGPLLIGFLVPHFGWSAAPALVIPTALIGVITVAYLRVHLLKHAS